MMSDETEKGMITETGMLYIERRGRLVSAACPYSSVGATTAKCGEWCPHFGEPHESELLFAPEEDNKTRHQLKLSCGNGRLFVFREFEDLRKIPPAKPQEPDPINIDPADIGVPI